MKPWLVAHRGASKEAPENTMAAFAAARKYAVGYLEFDVRITKDNIAVIHHDPAIGSAVIAETDFDTLRSLDPQLARFETVIAEHHELPLFVELKSSNSARHVLSYLESNPTSFATSFLEDELITLQQAGIAGSRLFLAQHNHLFGLLQRTRSNKFGGITINKWYLTPYLHWRAKKAGLKIMTYTVNSALWARLMRYIYPDVFICTDVPHKLESIG